MQRMVKPTVFSGKTRVHSVWLSDIHLGNRDCKANFLLHFLDSIETCHLYLVGDIVDVWSMHRQFYWPAEHNQIIRRFINMAKDGVQITYIPGNHDSVFREYCGESFGAIKVLREATHITKTGKKLLVTHGDEFDESIRFSGFNRFFGDHAYDFLLFLNRCNNVIRRKLGYDYWSLAAYIKSRIANAARVIAIFENAARKKSEAAGYDGIVCGHIHHPNVIDKDNILYCNDGDWVENCTTLVETNEGALEIWHWSDRSRCLSVVAPQLAA